MFIRACGASSLVTAILIAASTLSASAAGPAAPTSVVATAPMATQVALTWTASSGATSYHVYRGTSTGGETLVSTASTIIGTTFEDAGDKGSASDYPGLSNGTKYFYQITALNGTAESSKSTEVSVTTQPGLVTTLTCTAGDSQVTLNWNSLTNATGYRIYRDTLGGIGGALAITVGNTTTATDTGLVNGTTYFYSVGAFNASGENFGTGAFASATPTGTSSFGGVPTNLRATPGNAQVVLNWNPVSNAASYNIFRSIPSNGTGASQIGNITSGTAYTDTNVSNGTTYSYTVQAVNPTHTSSQTSAVTATPLVPGAPTGLVATASSQQVSLTWTATGTSYAVYRGTTSGGEVLLDSGMTGNTFTDAGVANNFTYYYQVQALNANGTGPISAEVTATPSGSTPSGTSWVTTFGLPGEPPQSLVFTIPDLNRPIRGAMLTAEGGTSSYMYSVAQKYNLININIDGFTGYNFGTSANSITLDTPFDTSHGICVLDYRWPVLSGQRIQAALAAAVAAFPNHPEIANVGVVLDGFSTGEDNVNLAVTQSGATSSPLLNRVLATIHLSELDEDRYNPLATVDTAPHLFIASGSSDVFSSLNLGVDDFPSVTHDTEARGLATNQGAPLTTIDNAGFGHGNNQDHPFISIWLDSILSQRLPAGNNPSTPVTLPTWQNSSAWVGTYNVTQNVTTSPWGTSGSPGVQLTSNLVSARGSYSDSRPFTWLPSKNAAQAWLTYANIGTLTSLVPVLIGPTTANATVSYPFTYQITAANMPTSYNATGLPSGLSINKTTGVISGTPTGSGISTITLTAANPAGTSTSSALTLTVNSGTTLTFAQWESNNGISGANAAATPENDGVPNLLKYVFDINPSRAMTASDQAALPKGSSDTTTTAGSTYLTLTYRSSTSVTGVTVSAQTSQDMVNWSTAVPVNQLPIFQQTPIAGSTDVTTTIGVNATGMSTDFIRLQVTLSP
jgi:fibronectin type 3 domain-containing protein